MKTYENFINKPRVKYYEKSESWILNGYLHREDGPAYQQWYENGQKWIGPVYQQWYENGQKRTKRWWLNGKLHREDGPAYQRWHKDGQKEYERWWLNGKEYSRGEWVEKLKEIGSPHYDEQRMLLDAEKYNL